MKRQNQNWTEIEFADCLGMATNVVNPGRQYAQRILNQQTHEKPGALKLRPGYTKKYVAPSNEKIVNLGFLNFDTFYDRQAIPEGREITCLIQQGEIQAVLDGIIPVIPDTQNLLCFWVRPYWGGEFWIDDWNWINTMFITKIVTGSDATYQNMIKVFGNETQSLGNNSVVGFTIYNKTKDQYAKVITSKTEGNNIHRIAE